MQLKAVNSCPITNYLIIWFVCFVSELEKEITRRSKKVCIIKVVGTRNLWKNIVVLCVNS